MKSEKDKRYCLRKNEIYSNCALYDHKGLLCRCSIQRAKWYVKKGLATVISQEPFEILLNFDPCVSLAEREEVYSIHKKNICSVCGEDSLDKLTKHHIVPLAFRKQFPEHYKSCMSHDVVPVCIDCHTAYHKHATVKINEMFRKCTQIKANRKLKKRIQETLSGCRALELPTVPEQRKQEIISQIYQDWDKQLTIQQITEACLQEKAKAKLDAEIYIENLPISLDEFIMLWRLDFVEIMSPRFLPKGWSLKHKLHN